MRGWRKRSPAAVSPQADERRDLRVEVVADNPSASAPQQRDTQMAHSYPAASTSPKTLSRTGASPAG
jgi:hypothetical protein